MNFDNIVPGDEFDVFSAPAAPEFTPIPAGRYTCIAESGGLKIARSGTKGFNVIFRVLEGEQMGRKVWKFLPLTKEAASYTSRDLQQFRISKMEQLRNPLSPERFVCEVLVSIDKERSTNKVDSFKVLRVEEPKPDPFAPTDDGGGS